MPNDKDPINSFSEQSNSSPKRTRPTDKQMGLGSEDALTSKTKVENKKVVKY